MSETFNSNRKLFEGRKLFVEIGPDSNPVPLVGTRIFGSDEQYLGIDPSFGYFSSNSIEQLKELGERTNGHYELFNGIVQQMCLPEGCADTVYLANVLGAYFPLLDMVGVDNELKREGWESTLEASVRLQSKQGELIIVENMTPYRASFFRVETVLIGLGLTTISHSNHDWDIKVFNHRGDDGKPDSYIARFAYPSVPEAS